MLGTVSGSISEQRTSPELPIPQRANVLGVGIHNLNLGSTVELMEAAVFSQVVIHEVVWCRPGGDRCLFDDPYCLRGV